MRVFQNTLQTIDNGDPNLEIWENSGYIQTINDKKYKIRSASWTATPIEKHRNEIIKKHVENIQKYIDPLLVMREYSQVYIDDIRSEMRERAEMMGSCKGMFQCVKLAEGIPTKPPCQPRIVVEENIIADTEEPE